MPTAQSPPSTVRFASVALALAAALALAVVWLWPARSEPEPVWVPPGEAPPLAQTLDRLLERRATPLAPGLAVRPLAVADGDALAGEAADAMCDAVVARLMREPALRVSSCASTRTALAAGLDDAGLSHLLAVRLLVKGKVASTPQGRLRVQLALHEAGRGQAHWQLDEEMAPHEVQGLTRRVARAASEALGRELATPELPELPPGLLTRYQEALRLARLPDRDTRAQALQIVESELLPQAPAHAPSIYLRLALRIMGAGQPREAPEARAARDAALTREIAETGQRLLRDDPGNARAHVLLLNQAFKERRWDDGFAQIEQMVRHARQQPFVLRLAARFHLYAGYVGRAAELAREAARIDALDAESIESLALVHAVRADDARAQELVALAEQLGHRGTGLLRMVLARRAGDGRALEAAARAWAVSTGHPDTWVADFVRAAADPAQRAAARAAFDAMDASARDGMADYFIERALIGDAEGSARAVQLAARGAPARWVEQLWWPEMAGMRQQPAFGDALKLLGLDRLWATRGAPDLCQAQAGTWRCR